MVMMTEKYRSSTKYDEDYHFPRCLPASFSAVGGEGPANCEGTNILDNG